MPKNNHRRRTAQALAEELCHPSQSKPLALTLAQIERHRQNAIKKLKEIWKEETNRAFLPAFPQFRSAERSIKVVEGMLFSTVTGTIADSIRARGMDQEDASADMRALSRMESSDTLFEGVFNSLLPFLPKDGPLVLAIDDTVLPKRGKKMDYTRWCHNPLAPPWQHMALMNGHPVFHAAVIVPDEKTKKPLAITVAFKPVKPLPKELRKKRYPRKSKGKQGKKSKKRAKSPKGKSPKKRGRPTKAEAARRKEEEQELRRNYPTAPDVAVETIKLIRCWMDKAGMQDRLLLVVGDGSYTNATVFFQLPERCVYVGRVRPDASLEPIGKRRGPGEFQYGHPAKKPHEMATDKYYPTQRASFIYGADDRILKYKEVGPLTRKNSTKKQQLRLLLLRPTGYRENGVLQYSHEAFLLTSDHQLDAEVLIQGYLWRWAIEVNHRNSKTYAKIGQAQARVAKSVINVHPALAAAFSLLWICILKLNGGTVRTEIFLPQSSWQRSNFEWRKKKRLREGKRMPVQRASAVDVMSLFREAMFDRWKEGLPRAKSI